MFVRCCFIVVVAHAWLKDETNGIGVDIILLLMDIILLMNKYGRDENVLHTPIFSDIYMISIYVYLLLGNY